MATGEEKSNASEPYLSGCICVVLIGLKWARLVGKTCHGGKEAVQEEKRKLKYRLRQENKNKLDVQAVLN